MSKTPKNCVSQNTSTSFSLTPLYANTYFSQVTDFDSKHFRIPFCEISNDNVLIVGGDLRYDHPGDVGNIDIGIKLSNDFGKSFHSPQVILKNHRLVENSRIIDASILVDRLTNRIFVFAHCIDSNQLWEHTSDPKAIVAYMVYTYSDDNGQTWSPEISLEHLKDATIVSLFPGPGKGITLSDSTLVVPCQIKTTEEDGLPSIQSCIIVSKDHGATWEFKGGRIPEFSSECQAVELPDGSIMLNCRSYAGYRRVFISHDLGATWHMHQTNCNTLIEPYACQASLDQLIINNQPVYIFCNPKDVKERKNICLQHSFDTLVWQDTLPTLVEGLTYGYTCLCHNEDYTFVAIERTGTIELHTFQIK